MGEKFHREVIKLQNILGVIALIGAISVPLCFPASAQTLNSANDPDKISDSRPAHGTKNIAQAWLIDETQRYDHFVQGSRYEAGGLRVLTSSGKVLTFELSKKFVFEDRVPRLADLNGDGNDEVVLVLSDAGKGASLAVFSVVGSEIILSAQTPYIGQKNRWLNPAGIADFDGDGQVEIALVQMPHLEKRLEFWRLQGGALTRVAAVKDVSNHKLGSRNTEMSAVFDVDADGLPDLIVPSGDRRTIRVLSFDGKRVEEKLSVKLEGAADGKIVVLPTSTGSRIRVELENHASTQITVTTDS